jgi:hypothetical protein
MSSDRFYVGRRGPDGKWQVLIDGERRLKLRLDLASHSPTGFAWGYAGSGPAQLALAILADALGDGKAALALHQLFKFAVIAPLVQDLPWRLDMRTVLKAAVEAAGPCALMREGNRVYRICGDCGEFLSSRGLIIADECGVFDLAPGITGELIKTAAMAHHGRGEGFVPWPPEP